MTSKRQTILISALALAVCAAGCDDGSHGRDGRDGAAGDDGQDGQDGAPGRDGEDGAPGAAGSPGSSCSVSDLGQGQKLLSCDDGTSVTIRDGADADQVNAAAGRLIFGDAEADGLRVLDLATGRILASFSGIAPNATLYTTESGRVVGAVQGTLNRVDFLDTGLAIEEGHEKESAPRLLDFSLVGEEHDTVTPIHFVSHHGYVTVHFDGRYDAATPANNVDAKNFVISEADLLDADGEPTLVLQTAPQHGVSVVTGRNHVLLSLPSADLSISTSPNGFAFYDLGGDLLQTIQDGDDFLSSCWGLHGEAVAGDHYLFGCHQSLDGGVMVLAWDEQEGEYVARKLTYPGYPQAPKRTSVLRGHVRNRFAVGQWGVYGSAGSEYTGLIRIDPSSDALKEEDALQLGAVYCDFDFERKHGERVLALARNGQLHAIHVETWSEHKMHALFPNDGSCPGRMVTGEGVVYITHTEKGQILEVDVESLNVVRTFHVGGKPANAALAGWWGPVEAH